MAKGTPIAAEAQRARFTLAEPLASQEIESVLRAAAEEPHGSRALEALSMRARRIAADHATWTAWLALGVVERRRGAYAHRRAKRSRPGALSASEGSAATRRRARSRRLRRPQGRRGRPPGTRSGRSRSKAIRRAPLGALAEARIASGERVEEEALLAIARAKTLAPDGCRAPRHRGHAEIALESRRPRWPARRRLRAAHVRASRRARVGLRLAPVAEDGGPYAHHRGTARDRDLEVL